MRKQWFIFFFLPFMISIGAKPQKITSIQEEQKGLFTLKQSAGMNSEQNDFTNYLKTMETVNDIYEIEVKIKKIKEDGTIQYPVHARGKVKINCLNDVYIDIQGESKDFVFSTCEEVSLSNWKGKFKSSNYDEVWFCEIRDIYKGMIEEKPKETIINLRVYWKKNKFVLKVVYYPNSKYINLIQDRISFDKTGF